MQYFSKFEIIRFDFRRGARHGIKMNGKLQRLQEQEEQILSLPSEKKEKKKTKHKSTDEINE